MRLSVNQKKKREVMCKPFLIKKIHRQYLHVTFTWMLTDYLHVLDFQIIIQNTSK